MKVAVHPPAEQPSTMLTFRAVLCSSTLLFMSSIDRHMSMPTIAIYTQPRQAKYQRNRKNFIGMNYNYKNYVAMCDKQ